MPLLKLPVELLDLIIECIHTESSEAHTLSLRPLLDTTLACSALRNVAQPWIFREIRLSFPSNRAELLLRSLRENPLFGNYIQHLIIWDRSEEFEGNAEDLSSLFSHLTNLRQLYAPLFPPSALSPILLSTSYAVRDSLEFLVLDGSSLTTWDLLTLLSYPHLRHFTAFGFDDVECRNLYPEVLQSLRLASLGLASSQIGLPLMQRLLEQCSDLEHLDFIIPVPPTSSYIRRTGGILTAASVSCPISLSMTPVQTLLDPFQDTLVELNIRSGRQLWQGQDKIRLSLRKFGALKKLLATSSCFFTPSSLVENKKSFYELLPPSLVELEIKFGFDTGIFFITDANDEVHKQNLQRFHEENISGSRHYTWIQTLAVHKSTHFPDLQQVRFDEDMLPQRWRGVYAMEEWSPPDVVNDTFKRAGITLSASFRSTRALPG